MKSKLLLIICIFGVIAFTAVGVQDSIKRENKAQLEQVQLSTKNAKIKQLELEVKLINEQLDKAIESEQTSKETIESIKGQLDEVNRQKQELERQVSLKRQQTSKIAQANTKLVNTLTGTKTVSAQAGDKFSLMAAAGISPGDYGHVDFIISHESGWRHLKYNDAGSGAYGLCQALPASKMVSAGADFMTNPVTQLKWCNGYANSRYGGWAGARRFWEANKWW